MASPEYAFAAHLLRRTQFHVTRDEVESLAALSRDDMVAMLVDNAKARKIPANPGFRNLADKAKDRDFTAMLRAELNRLNSPDSGLADRMLWFWHGLLTTAMNKVDYPGLLWRQHRLLAKHALGNFRQMLLELTVDPAMLFYLDGDGSNASTDSVPNENYARELMELFSLGRVNGAGDANYAQTDVTAAAKALAGWYVTRLPNRGPYDPNRVRVLFDESAAYSGTITFLGEEIALDASVDGPTRIARLVDRILEQPAAALYIVRKLFTYFVHDDPAPETLQTLADTFVHPGHKYELMPVLQQLFRLDEFGQPKAMAGRARLPLEWLAGMLSAVGLTARNVNFEDYFYSASQVPFDPPNVAGWAIGNRWVSVTQAMARAQVATTLFDISRRHKLLKTLASAIDPVTEITKTLSLYDLSEQTRAQLSALFNNKDPQTFDFDTRLGPVRAILALALSSPEFALT